MKKLLILPILAFAFFAQTNSTSACWSEAGTTVWPTDGTNCIAEEVYQ